MIGGCGTRPEKTIELVVPIVALHFRKLKTPKHVRRMNVGINPLLISEHRDCYVETVQGTEIFYHRPTWE